MLAIAIASVCLLLFVVDSFLTGFSIVKLINLVLPSLLGILLTVVIFNIGYEYLTSSYVAGEVSQQIIRTLTGNPESINFLKHGQKTNFIESIISSILAEETVDENGADEKICNLAYSALSPYLKPVNYKKSFTYAIVLQEISKALSTYFDTDHYIAISQNVDYKKVYAKGGLEKEFFVGFFTKNFDIDKELIARQFLFCDHLQVDPSDLRKLSQSLSTHEDKIKFITEGMEFGVRVKPLHSEQNTISDSVTIKDVNINEDRIIITLTLNYEPPLKEIYFGLTYVLPQLKSKNTFFVLITEPTQELNVQFSYGGIENMDAFIHPFLEDDSNCRVENWHRTSKRYIINMTGSKTWVYPHSGIVFVFEKKGYCKKPTQININRRK